MAMRLRPLVVALGILLLVPMAALVVYVSGHGSLVSAVVATWAIASSLGFVVFLAGAYITAYVVSAAWHDAQNTRRQ